MCDRLIELLEDTLQEWECDVSERTISQIAEHLLENGVICPPCKVGDFVYSYCDEFGVILPYFVVNFHIGFLDKETTHYYFEANSHAEETDEFLDEIDFEFDDIGKTVFLTKEEAEKALKGGAE